MLWGLPGNDINIYRLLTGPLRVLPGFIIIGAQRSGTTALFRYLSQHPCVVPALKKEVHFFDNNYGKGINWYRAHFPLCTTRMLKKKKEKGFLTGEASPYYLFHPHAPRRVAERLPHVKIIALLRNPVDRAYSQYQKNLRRGEETLSFEEAIKREEERLAESMNMLASNGGIISREHQKWSYLARGIYVTQLERWMKHFQKRQILVAQSEVFYSDPNCVIEKVLKFLGLPVWKSREHIGLQYPKYPRINEDTRKDLVDYFRVPNQMLYELIREEFTW